MINNDKTLIGYIPGFLEFLEVEKGLAQLSVKNYDRFLNKFRIWLDKNYHNLKPADFTGDILYQFRIYLSRQGVNSKTGQNLKKSTQNYYLIALRNFLSYLIDKDINTLPPNKVKLSKDKSQDRVVKFLSLEQLERLLAGPVTKNIRGLRDRAILETLFSTGLRIAELVALNREQFNLKVISNTKLDSLELTIVGKGSHPRPVYFSRRCLDWLIRYLNARKDMDKALFAGHGPNSSSTEESRLTPRAIENLMVKYNLKND
ncbi:MAG: tyrosine-type recombinase/integrase [Candidatus Parcubacteria bacterium]|nr:tyrosine-type recombinase/integrase [Candidatus Parcubacteria bacterium]